MNKTVRMICLDSMFLALLVVCTFFTIQAGMTKFTLQLLAVFLIANLLPLADGLIIVTCYIAMGLIGIPVFAGFMGGPTYVLAPTFGFVYGFYFVILINHLFNDVILKKVRYGIVRNIAGSAVSLITLYAVGFTHGYLILVNLKGMSDLTIASGLGIFIVPYIPFDIAKLVIAAPVSSRFANYIIPTRKYHLDEVDSTNTYLLDNYKSFGDMTFVDASYQSKGRGRMGRAWESNKNDSLMFSVLVKDKKTLQKAALLPLLAGSAVLRSLESLNVQNVAIKWPNDVYVDGKKISGILCESVSEGTNVKALVIGIGLNLNQESFPEGLRHEPTSLRLELGREVSIKAIKKNLYKTLKDELKAFKKGESHFLETIDGHNYLKGQDCYCVYEGEEKLIHVNGIAEDGSLRGIIDGEERNVFSDEITFR